MALELDRNDGHLAMTYSLIYSFLQARSHDKIAKSLKKAVKDIVILKSSPSDSDGQKLEDIIRNWKLQQASQAGKAQADGISSMLDATTLESPSRLTTSGTSDPEDVTGLLQEEAPDEHSENERETTKKRKKSKKMKIESATGAVVDETLKLSDKSQTTVKKKRKVSEDGASVPTAVSVEAEAASSSVPDKAPRKTNTPFQRIKADEITFYDTRLQDNSFESRGVVGNDYGAKASQDLIVTRGAGFRKEKNKKKRGSYRGGEITMESHSIKFT